MSQDILNIPIPDGSLYTSNETGEEVELLWTDVGFIDDEGFNYPLAIYLDSNDNLQAIEENLFCGGFRKVEDPTPDLYEQY
jgi:hypothetical protein